MRTQAPKRAAIITVLSVICGLGNSLAWANPSAVFGRWAEERSILEFRQEANGQLSGTVVALRDPLYTAEDAAGAPGTPRRDHNNPDPALRGRPMLGANLLSDYRYNEKSGQWRGKIYDPESGNTYSSRMNVDRDGNLRMRGYLGIPMLGRTAIFEPVSRCSANILGMLRKAGLEDCVP